MQKELDRSIKEIKYKKGNADQEDVKIVKYKSSPSANPVIVWYKPFTLTVVAGGNSGISKVEYSVNNGTTQITTSNKTVDIKYSDKITWKAYTQDGYDFVVNNKIVSGSTTGTIEKVESDCSISPKAVKWYIVSNNTPQGSVRGTYLIDITRTSSKYTGIATVISWGSTHIYEGDKLKFNVYVSSLSNYGHYYLIDNTNYTQLGVTPTYKYQNTNSSRNGWTDSNSESDSTGMKSKIEFTKEVGADNVVIAIGDKAVVWREHSYSEEDNIKTPELRKKGSVDLELLQIDRFRNVVAHYPMIAVKLNGALCLEQYSTGQDFSQILTSLSKSANITYAGISGDAKVYHDSTKGVSVITLTVTDAAGAYDFFARIWSVSLPEMQ